MEIHFIEEDGLNIAFFPKSYKFFEINDVTKLLIKSYIEGNTLTEKELVENYKITKSEFSNFIEEVKKNDVDINQNKLFSVSNYGKTLNRLAINLSNKCNLKCKYCYANGGSYNSEEGNMAEEVAKKALDTMYDKYETINTIQLFGGEPTLNIPLIKFVCEYVSNKYNKKELSKMPLIGMVSNGIILTEELIELVKKYNINITYSFDGNNVVNDKMRVFENQSATSEIILNNIKRLKSATNQPSGIEVTYNKHHVENNVSIKNIIEFVTKEYKDMFVHIVPVGGDKSCDYVLDNFDPFIDAVDDLFETFDSKEKLTYMTFSRLLNNLKNKVFSKNICDAGFGTLSVSIKGDLYPCFMFTDNADYKMGNIFDENLFLNESFLSHNKKYIEFDKYSVEDCKSCYARNICFGCMGINDIENGTAFNPIVSVCSMHKKMIDKIIVNIVKKQKEEHLNKKVIENERYIS